MSNPNIQGTGAKLVVVACMLFIFLGVSIMAFGEWTGWFSMFPAMGAIGGGATTLSLTKTQFTDSSSIPVFSGDDVWILHITPSGQGQDFVGKTVTKTITPDEMSNKGANEQPESNLKISLNSVVQNCVYSIQEDNENPPGYDDVRYDNHVYVGYEDRWSTMGKCSPSEIDDKCGNKPFCTGGSVCWMSWLGEDCDCWAYWLEPYTVAIDANIASIPKIRTITEFGIEKDGIYKDRIFDTDRENGKSDEGFLPEGTNDLAYVTWTGYNAIGSCTYADAEHGSIYDIGSYYGFKNKFDNKWHIGEKSKYQNYKNVKASILTSLKDKYGTSVGEQVYDDMQEDMLTLGKAGLLATSNKDNVFGGVQADSKGKYDAMIIQPLKSLSFLPNYVLYIKADWLKIDTNTDVEPVITDVKFNLQGDETKVGTIAVTAKNSGTDNGELTYSVECNYPFERLTDIQRRYVNTQSEKTATFSIGLSTGITKKICRTCTVEVVNKWDVKDTEQIEVCTSPNEWCIPGQKYCGLGSDSNAIVTCNSDGTNYLDSPKVNCGTSTCTYKDGGVVPYCREPAMCIKDSDCDDNNPNTRDKCIDAFFGGKKCENIPINVCTADSDCADDLWYTIDTCDKSRIGDLIGGKGVCKNFDVLPILVILILFIVLIAMSLFIAGILGLAVYIKKGQQQPPSIIKRR